MRKNFEIFDRFLPAPICLHQFVCAQSPPTQHFLCSILFLCMCVCLKQRAIIWSMYSFNPGVVPPVVFVGGWVGGQDPPVLCGLVRLKSKAGRGIWPILFGFSIVRWGVLHWRLFWGKQANVGGSGPRRKNCLSLSESMIWS